ncbi:MAG: ATP-binding protein [Tannerellaceae bacterium]|nr:ATP-binding protein [Tannerellaceae bacterium]
MDGHNTVVGKNLIDILMFSMYPDARIIYREYIQNACDAINEAVEKGVLSQYKDGHITVNIDANRKEIQIMDNGTGVAYAEIGSALLNVADSRKDGTKFAGLYGIGRLVGGGYCRELSFKTSTKGEDKASEIIFNVDMARDIMSDDEDHRTAAEVIDAITTSVIHEEEPDKHYFIATLKDIRPDYPELLDEEIITDYLREVAPVDFGLPFKNNILKESLSNEYKEYYNNVRCYQISVNDELDIRKRYGLTVEGTGDMIHGLEFFKIEDEQYGLLGWGWYALTQFSTAIPAKDTNRGIRLRKHNILIGARDVLNKYFKEPRGNNYFYGEVYAVHPKLRPESSRSGLAPTSEAVRFQQLLGEHFETLQQLYRVANNVKNAYKKYLSLSSQLTPGQTPDAVPELKAELDKAEIVLEKAISHTNAQTDVAKRLITIIKNDPGDYSSGTTFPISSGGKSSSDEDILVPLEGKYPKDKISLIRRIFSLFTKHSKDKEQIEIVKKKVVKELSK